MNESVSPQRRRPPGWRAARAAPEPEAAPSTAGAPDGPAEDAEDAAFARGETAERPAIRIPADDHDDNDDQDDDHPVFGSRRDDDRTRTMDAVAPSRRDVDRRDDDDPVDDAADGGDDAADDEQSTEGHPVAVPLGGFFTGMAYILVLPVLYVWLSDPDSIADAIGVDLVWLVAAVLVPVFLTAIPQTRKFGRYMLLGVGLSAVIVIGVAAVVLAVLIFLA